MYWKKNSGPYWIKNLKQALKTRKLNYGNPWHEPKPFLKFLLDSRSSGKNYFWKPVSNGFKYLRLCKLRKILKPGERNHGRKLCLIYSRGSEKYLKAILDSFMGTSLFWKKWLILNGLTRTQSRSKSRKLKHFLETKFLNKLCKLAQRQI